MWIRSQNKKLLIDVQNVVVSDNLILTDLGSIAVLGEYNTEERAIEILDQIQHNKRDYEYYRHNERNSIEGVNTSSSSFEHVTFEMPKG